MVIFSAQPVTKEKLSSGAIYNIGTMLNQDPSVSTAGRKLFGTLAPITRRSSSESVAASAGLPTRS